LKKPRDFIGTVKKDVDKTRNKYGILRKFADESVPQGIVGLSLENEHEHLIK
jgi:hypothetical protein